MLIIFLHPHPPPTPPSVKDVAIVSQPIPALLPNSSQASAGEAPMEAAQGESVECLQLFHEVYFKRIVFNRKKN